MAITERPLVRLAFVSAYLPPQERTSAEVEQRIRDASPGFSMPPGIIETMAGVRTRRAAGDGVATSDLAAAAGRDAIRESGVAPSDIDLLIFASASQDLIEPATANVAGVHARHHEGARAARLRADADVRGVVAGDRRGVGHAQGGIGRCYAGCPPG
jgi:hypothetical protein